MQINLYPSVKKCGCLTHCNCALKKYIGTVTWILAIFILIFAGTSCNITKKIDRLKTTEAKVNDLVTVFTATTTELIDTVVTIPTSSVTADKDIDAILGGDSIYEDTPELTITTKYYHDRIFTKVVKKPQFIPVKLERTTQSSSIAIAHNATNTVVDSKVKNVEKRPSWINWLWLLLLIPVWMVWRWLRG